ncbi:hypothetical protein ABGV42_13015 [Paenibacillus pabuli]|uniref:hypothetical protein n=1 Tax=Paenibacillus pabuli TaxID=1472 RepID=UPI003242B078
MTIVKVALIAITALLMIIGVRGKRKSVLRWGIASFIALIILIIPAFINGFVDGLSDGWSAR